MKFHNQIVATLLTFLLIFTVGFQGIHGGIHLVKQFSEKHCHHKYQKHKNEINHSHHDEDCSSCEFVFSAFTSSNAIIFTLIDGDTFSKPNFFEISSPIVNAFYNFNLRAPPIVLF